MDLKTTQAFAKRIIDLTLENPDRYSWSLQGFGMLRYYVSDAVRMNVWDSAFKVPGVSEMHTHPWMFRSWILTGVLENRRYAEDSYGGSQFHRAIIKPGPGGGMRDPLPDVWLVAQPLEIYRAGMEYQQAPEEIHWSRPADGTVTLNHRVRTGYDIAQVFWRVGQEWVSAEPREATVEEKVAILQRVTFDQSVEAPCR